MRKNLKVLSILRLILIAMIILTAAVALAQEKDAAKVFADTNRWVSSTSTDTANILRITIHDGDSIKFITDGHRDHKPVWSKEGDKITFFRATGKTELKPFNEYRTYICVINVDGSGYKKLTDAENPNVNPTWTRDGSNKVLFNRLSKSEFGKARIFVMSPDAAVNDTTLISDPDNFEWAESGLKDGRMFIFRLSYFWYVLNYFTPFYTFPNTQSYFLLDPETKEYYPVERQNKFPTHKLSVSPTETKVCYMKDLDGKLHTYSDAVIAYAEFDLENLEIKSEVVISEENQNHIDMYPRWSSDERYIIYSSSRNTDNIWDMSQYMYDLKTGKTSLVSGEEFLIDMYPCFEDLPK